MFRHIILFIGLAAVLCSCSVFKPTKSRPSVVLGPRAQDFKPDAGLASRLGIGVQPVERLPAPPLVITKEVKREMRQMLLREGRYIEHALNRRRDVYPTIAQIFHDEGVPLDLLNLALIESGFNLEARSHMGAVGMWQFMKSTARLYGLKVERREDQRKDVVLSTLAAARHLKDLYWAYNDWYLALAAYNMGPGGLDRLMASRGVNDFWSLASSGKLNLQTKTFVPKFIAAALIVRNMERHTLTEMAANLDLVVTPETHLAEVEGVIRPNVS